LQAQGGILSMLQLMDRGQKKILPKSALSEGKFRAKKAMVQSLHVRQIVGLVVESR